MICGTLFIAAFSVNFFAITQFPRSVRSSSVIDNKSRLDEFYGCFDQDHHALARPAHITKATLTSLQLINEKQNIPYCRILSRLSIFVDINIHIHIYLFERILTSGGFHRYIYINEETSDNVVVLIFNCLDSHPLYESWENNNVIDGIS